MSKNTKQPKFLTEGAIREIVQSVLRTAIHDQARELEGHLRDIDRRLKDLEKRR